MCHMRVRASGWNQGVQRGVADACALGGAKGACRGVVLCMLVVARANALRSARQMQTLQTTFICLSLSTEGASYMVGCGLMSSIQPCMRGTPRTDDATAKWFATRVWLGTSEKTRFWPLRSGPGPAYDVLHAGLTPPRSLSDIHLKRTAFSSPHAATACMGRVHGSDRAPPHSLGPDRTPSRNY
jgi:hypothetical protein